MEASDQILLRRWARERDEEAFLALITRHAGMVYGTCRRVLGNATEAEDVAQECFETLATSGDRYGSWLGAWLHRVATCRSLDRLRKEQRRVQRETLYAGNAARSTTPTWDDIYASVDEAIAELPEKLREPLIEHFLEGRSLEMIAESAGVTRQATHYRVQKGLERIRGSLKRRGIMIAAVSLGALFRAHAAEAAPSALVSRLGKIALSAPAIPASSGISSLLDYFTFARTVPAVVLLLVLAVSGTFYIVREEDLSAPAQSKVALPHPSSVAMDSEPIPDSPTNASSPPTPEHDDSMIFAGHIHGLTVMPDGTPAPAVRVALDRHLSPRKESKAFHAETTSDANGRYEFKNVPLETGRDVYAGGMYELTAHADDLFGMASVWRLHGYRDQYAELILYKNEGISGVVVDTQGKPIGGATVEPKFASVGVNSFGPLGVSRSATADDNGEFECMDLFPGAYNLSVEARGYAPVITSRYPIGSKGIRVALSSSIVLRGRVMDTVTGNPVSGVKIWALNKRTHRNSEDPTGPDGVFTIQLPEGTYELDTVAGPYLRAGKPLSVEIRPGQKATDVVIEVAKGATVRGRVSYTAEPREKQKIYVTARPGDQRGPSVGTTADKDGSFVLEGLSSGAYVIEAADRDRLASRRMDVTAGQSYEGVELALAEQETSGLRGRVIDTVGRPVPLASVFLKRSTTSTEMWSLADEEGRFAFRVPETDNPQQNPAYLQAVTEDALSAPVGPIARANEKEFVVRLQPAARIDGSVMDNRGRGIPNAVIVATPSTADGLNVIPLSVDANNNIYNMNLDEIEGNRTTSFLQGRFTMWPLFPGSYTVSAFMAHTTADSPGASTTVTLAPGQALSGLTLVVKTEGLGAIEGMVTRGGMPVRGQSVEAQAQTGRTAQMYAYSGPDGRYRIENVPPGDVSVALHGTVGLKRENVLDMQRFVTLSPGETAQVDFPLARGSATVEGTVLINGRPNPRVEVIFTSSIEPNSSNRAVCDENGYYKAENLMPGEYDVQMIRGQDVGAGQAGVSRSDKIVVADNDALRLDWNVETAGIRGTVTGLQPGESAVVALLPPETQVPTEGTLDLQTLLALEQSVIKQMETETGEIAFENVDPGEYVIGVATFPLGQKIEEHLDSVRYTFQRVTVHAEEVVEVELILKM